MKRCHCLENKAHEARPRCGDAGDAQLHDLMSLYRVKK
jgi:hypothetical protein